VLRVTPFQLLILYFYLIPFLRFRGRTRPLESVFVPSSETSNYQRKMSCVSCELSDLERDGPFMVQISFHLLFLRISEGITTPLATVRSPTFSLLKRKTMLKASTPSREGNIGLSVRICFQVRFHLQTLLCLAKWLQPITALTFVVF